ncbi:uncharacterized protein KIAA0513-like isoform X2 [Varroa jacobsoni]|uniref:uncharacterized protein KIAA0513-like isoform X2 n=1 Tax=Varroa jacobsoni TaxID=62625 RepID=UPI000BF616B1|nr:uncharacterized protein KIAA0513-like isoform X2 [Varroa jacobsoni]
MPTFLMKRQRLFGVAECIKFAMTTQLLPASRRHSLELTIAHSGESVRHFSGRFLPQPEADAIAAHCPPNISQTNGDTKKGVKICRSKEQNSTFVMSLDALDSAIASRGDDDSNAGSIKWRANVPYRHSGKSELSIVHVEMEPCTVEEKVQRWTDTMSSRAQARSQRIERSQLLAAQRPPNAVCYRDSLDSGSHLLSLSSLPGAPAVDQLQYNTPKEGQTYSRAESKSQQQPQSETSSCRPGSSLSGHDINADDTSTSVLALSSSASDNEDGKTADDDSRLPSDCCCEFDTVDLKKIFQPALKVRNDADSLAADRRTSSGSGSWCGTEKGAGIEDEIGNACEELRSTSLPFTNEQKAQSPDVQEIMRFMDAFVIKILEDYASVSPEEKSRFGMLATTPEGRSAFARSLDGHRAGRACLAEGAFLSLAQSTAVMLFESCEADDWPPAKVLMNMCFTFYTEEEQNDGSIHREHLYSQLSSQPIWKNHRFWNAAFFEAILCERAKFLLPSAPSPNCMNQTGKDSPEITSQTRQRPDKESQRQCLENVTFSQLAVFTHNMHALGLPAQMCLQFLDKQLVIGNLPPGQKRLLRENVENLYRLQPKPV